MESIKFDGYTQAIAENQEEYETVYAHVGMAPPHFMGAKSITVCFKLTEEEIKQINETGVIWCKQLTFDNAMTPILLSTNNPINNG